MPWSAFGRVFVSAFCAALLLAAECRADPVTTACFDTSDRVRLCYTGNLQAEATAPLLVFIPGWTMPAAIWARQLAYFSGKYPWVAFDPRGQGRSAVPADGYTLERRVDDIEELLERFPGRPCVIVAWSLAVLEALAYVDRHGDRNLAGLVLVDSSIGEGPDAPPRNGENPFFAELRNDRAAALRDFVAAIFKTPVDPAMQAEVLASALRIDVEDSIRLLSYGKPRAYWREALYRTSKPVLYLATPPWREQAMLLRQKHPRATIRIFEDAGHALFWDAADRFNAEVDAFVQSMR